MTLSTFASGVDTSLSTKLNANFLLANSLKIGFHASGGTTSTSTSWVDLETFTIASSLECFAIEYNLVDECRANSSANVDGEFRILITYNDASSDVISLTTDAGETETSSTYYYDYGFFTADANKYITTIAHQGRVVVNSGTGGRVGENQLQTAGGWSTTPSTQAVQTGIKYYYKV